MPAPDPQSLRPFGDAGLTRKFIYDKVLRAASSLEPVENARHALTLHDVHWADPEDFTLREQKAALLEGRTLQRRLRGTWRLTDKATGSVLDQRRSTVAGVPYLTPRGTFILNGSDWSLSSQMRLHPGIYHRQRENGGLEAHVNVLPGRGVSHRVEMEPATGVFKLNVAQSAVPLFPVLRLLGARERDLHEAWGPELYAANKKHDDPRAVDKLYGRLVRRPDPGATPEGKSAAVRDALEAMAVDPTVTRLTLGEPHERLGLHPYLAVTRRLLDLARGHAEPDDRDHLAFQRLLGPEDLLAERFEKSRRVLAPHLWKATNRGSLEHLPAGVLTRHLHGAITDSGLGQNLEGVNNIEVHDLLHKVTRMGTGGIASTSAIPLESRAVQPSHLGYVDSLKTPEATTAGVDLRMSRSALKGPDGQVYTPFRDVRSGGREVLLSPRDLLGKVVAFPGELESGRHQVAALRDGRIAGVRRESVDYALPHMENGFTPSVNLVPFKSTVKGQRVSMGSRFLSQALPLDEPEAPLVQGLVPGTNTSFEERHGRHLGAVHARDGVSGRVLAVGPDGIRVRYDDGGEQTHELANWFPNNRKTALHNTPVVSPGDRVGPGQLLARSNQTDERGVAALGRNLRVAYLASGNSYEDAFEISESAARKLTSNHVYQHELEHEEGLKTSKKEYASIFPSRFDRGQLDALDEYGVIRPGSRVERGDPLALAARKREGDHKRLHSAHKGSYSDAALTWEHHAPGVVTDAVRTDRGTVVVVRSSNPMVEGDKLCFDPETRVLTRDGWVPAPAVTLEHEVATLNPETDELEWQRPTHVWAYDYSGPMYRLASKMVDMLVTPDHRLWVAPSRTGVYRQMPAEEFYRARNEWRFKKDCTWRGEEAEWFEFTPGKYAKRTQVLERARMDDWLEFLGYYVAEGWCMKQKNGGKYVRVAQFPDSPHHPKIAAVMDRLGLRYRYNSGDKRFEIGNAWLYDQLVSLGDSYTKWVPEYVQERTPRQIQIFLDAYLSGDGHRGGHWEYSSSSERLAHDVQLLCMKLGWCVHVKEVFKEGPNVWMKERHWRGRILRTALRPFWRKRNTSRAVSVVEEMVPYEGKVYCVTVPNHVLYVERGTKTYWTCNSGKFGDKGVVVIRPDDEMPVDESGRPIEVLVNPLSLISRCYDEATEFLTETGWKYGREVLPADRLVCYHPWTRSLHVMAQLYPMHVEDHDGEMIRFKNKLMDFCVTDDHRMWARCRYPGSSYQEVFAGKIFGKSWCVPVAGKAVPGVREDFVLPHINYRPKDHSSDKSDVVIDAGDFAEFLGWYASEGSFTWEDPVDGNGIYRVQISQKMAAHPENCLRIAELLNRLPFRWNYNEGNSQFHLTSIRLAAYCRQFGKCDAKFIPAWIFRQPPDVRQRFLNAYWAGDGSVHEFDDGRVLSGAGSRSERLVDDVQRLLLYQGLSGTKRPIKTRDRSRPMWRCSRWFKEERELTRRGWHRVSYRGKIYCPSVPTGYVVTRRNGCPLIAGNCNTGQVYEALLGKVAALRGEPYKVEDFDHRIPDLQQWVQQELDRHGVRSRETMTDPVTGVQIPNVLTGVRHYLKLHHVTESKSGGRGLGAVTAEGMPARGGEHGSKKAALGDIHAMLSHGALEVIRDAKLVRGAQNPEFWAAFMAGHRPPTPPVPFVYEKFINQLKGAGIHVVREGKSQHVMALTDRDVDDLAGARELQNAETVDWRDNLKPIKGGLFDEGLGGHSGRQWGKITLAEPLLNPVFEEPARRLLGLTRQGLLDVIAGRKGLSGRTGPAALHSALAAIDVPRALSRAREDIASGRKTKRDEAVKRLGYLKAAQATGVHPRDWVLSKVPVLPPAFRPVSLMQSGGTLVADANQLYRELFDHNRALGDLKGQVTDAGLADVRLGAYAALKAVVGLGDPVGAKSREKKLRGLLAEVLGPSSKHSVVQQKLLGTTVNTVGRGVIAPDPDLTMDEVGIPEEQAWSVYAPFVIRRLRRRGVAGTDAVRHVEGRSELARRAIVEEMAERPVILTRAPVLHRYGNLALFPRLAKGTTVRVNPFITKSQGADMDGDVENFHVPATDEAREEAIAKMLPSRNLFGVSRLDQPVFLAQQEYLGAPFVLTQRRTSRPPAVFATKKDALGALARGELDVGDEVVVLHPGK